MKRNRCRTDGSINPFIGARITMAYLLLVSLLFLIVGCGPSQSEMKIAIQNLYEKQGYEINKITILNKSKEGAEYVVKAEANWKGGGGIDNVFWFVNRDGKWVIRAKFY